MNTLMQAAVRAYVARDFAGAARECERVIAVQPAHIDALTLLGVIANELGQRDRALALLYRARALMPRNSRVHFAIGTVCRDRQELDLALAAYEQAVHFERNFAEAHNNKGNVLIDLGRLTEACHAFELAISLRPGFAEAIGNLGRCLHMRGMHAEAEARCREALTISPKLATACVTLGNALMAQGNPTAARESYVRAIEIEPGLPEAHHNLGALQLSSSEHALAVESLRRAVEAEPQLAEAHLKLGKALSELGRQPEALESYRKALLARPHYRDAAMEIGALMRFTGREAEALAIFDKMLAHDPTDSAALANRGAALMALSRYGEARLVYEQLTRQSPEWPYVDGLLLHTRMLCCDWSDFDQLLSRIREGLAEHREAAEPFGFQAIGQTPEELQRCARRYAKTHHPSQARARPAFSPNENDRITLGYVSGEFRHQATSILLTEILEKHDKKRFRLLCFDNGFDDGSLLRRRIEAAADEIININGIGDDQAARIIKDKRTMILLNLNGYFGRRRQDVFAMRPAPIQVNYLGFPGTLGVDYIDYIIADPIVLPADHRDFYDEKVVWLPDSYQPNDRKRAFASDTFSRSELGLPESGFVFCCFNNTYKILPDVFDVWMNILRLTPGSVLWLWDAKGTASSNLRREAANRRVDPSRLVFGSHMNLPEHLARLRVADLFLDTMPYNAHTTGSDALWAGLPVLTCIGNTFPSRVGASLLRAVGLPELITRSFSDYEALAIRLARDPIELSSIRKKLERNRLTTPLFDSERYTWHLEDAFDAMVERHCRGLAPDHITVRPRPSVSQQPGH